MTCRLCCITIRVRLELLLALAVVVRPYSLVLAVGPLMIEVAAA